MRLRGIAILALSTTACAAVIGLGDYEVEPEAAVEAGVEAGSDSNVASPTKEGGGSDALVDAPADGDMPDAGTDADAAVDADAGKAPDADAAAPIDAGPDAYANRDGIACSNTSEICSGSPPCCHQGSDAFSCLGSATCQGPANGDVFDCDDESDCRKTNEHCCVDLAADGRAQRSFCSSTCSGGPAHACITTADCPKYGPALQCLPPKTPYGTALPLLRICR